MSTEEEERHLLAMATMQLQRSQALVKLKAAEARIELLEARIVRALLAVEFREADVSNVTVEVTVDLLMLGDVVEWAPELHGAIMEELASKHRAFVQAAQVIPPPPPPPACYFTIHTEGGAVYPNNQTDACVSSGAKAAHLKDLWNRMDLGDGDRCTEVILQPDGHLVNWHTPGQQPGNN